MIGRTIPRHPRVHAEGLLYHVMARRPFSCLPSVKRKPCTAEELIELGKSDTYSVILVKWIDSDVVQEIDCHGDRPPS